MKCILQRLRLLVHVLLESREQIRGLLVPRWQDLTGVQPGYAGLRIDPLER